MKAFWGFVKKEIYHILRDKRTLVVILGIPIVEMLLFGFVLTNEIKQVNIAVCDLSKDEVTQQIIQKLEGSGYFKVKTYLSGLQSVESIFRRGKIKEVIVFEPHFSQKLQKEGIANVQLISDASDANFSNLVVNYTSAIINSYARELSQTSQQPIGIVPQIRMVYNPNLEGVYFFVPGIIGLILMLISALMTSVSIVREKEMGTMEVLLVSPLRPFHVIVGKVLPYVALSLINAAAVLLMSYFVFELPVKGSLVLLIVECLLYILLALSLGILISSITNSQLVAMMVSLVGLMLPTILLSGFIFPIENMPRILQWLCAILPPKYFIIIIKSIMIKGIGLQYIWFETLMLVLFTLLFMGLAIKKFKVRLT
ncbi:MAG TPA: ABC transporter permease [Bacteroidales bacterium]|nr:ABC transporter permease [Bacteroidales bacterium]HPO65121.1 ABC transporter permease [Bacteroidales bacterium]